jgi:hypothetical protein
MLERARHSRLLLLFLAGNGALAADGIQCPAQVQVRQQIATPIAGWSAGADKTPNQLSGLTFFDGKPEEEASLAPDSQTRQNGKDLLVWNFGADSNRPTFLVCRYAGTNVTLQRELPKGTRSCKVTYNPKQTIAGLPAIEKIDCK